MTESQTYRAPFAPGGTAGIDPEICQRLLAVALQHGGDYADLFFEYRAGGAISFEEGITRSASRSVSLGMGVRVQRGDATGYAHVEDLTWEAMKRAAETAARIATGGSGSHTVALARLDLPHRYELSSPPIDQPGTEKRALLERASAAALGFDSRIIKAEASYVEEIRAVLIASSDGRMAYDVQPLMRFGVRAIAESEGKREAGRSGGGGRMSLAYFDAQSPEKHAEIAAKQA
ncbi:MAG: metalloprotease TldD, partial [Myxococcales bacterium]|nr:metalloprotease TldD [Myxococcales bacterium]